MNVKMGHSKVQTLNITSRRKKPSRFDTDEQWETTKQLINQQKNKTINTFKAENDKLTRRQRLAITTKMTRRNDNIGVGRQRQGDDEVGDHKGI